MANYTLVDQSGTSYDIPPGPDGLLIGRQRTCGLVINDPTVSRRHARLFIAKDRCWIRDENSKSGTIVNQHHITTQQELQPGSLVQIGPATFSLRSSSSAQSNKPHHLQNTRRRTAIALIGAAGVSIVVLVLTLAGRESSESNITKLPPPTNKPTSIVTVPATKSAILLNTSTPTGQSSSIPTAIPTYTPTKNPLLPQPVTNLAELRKVVVRVDITGTFEIEYGQNARGGGSAFIINSEGLAVTNNHVVTGAGLLNVYLYDSITPVNARVLGVSECSDLAVIDLDGDGYDYLEWYSGSITNGLEVYSAGFPLDATKLVINKGQIKDSDFVVETDWASIDNAIDHTAKIRPGNSGGPLVTATGKVVGINYAISDYFTELLAISYKEALPIINKLKTGLDDHSIGVNGVAYQPFDDLDLGAIWVRSISSGSLADKAGIKPGDIIQSIESLYFPLDAEGYATMETYCDVLRSHDASDTLNIEVYRYDEQTSYTGQINGRPLEIVD